MEVAEHRVKFGDLAGRHHDQGTELLASGVGRNVHALNESNRPRISCGSSSAVRVSGCLVECCERAMLLRDRPGPLGHGAAPGEGGDAGQANALLEKKRIADCNRRFAVGPVTADIPTLAKQPTFLLWSDKFPDLY
jgi:hypothetical protein